MRKILPLVLALSVLSGCRSNATLSDGKEYSCIGIANEERIDPKVVYEVSTRNIVVGALFFEVVAPPVVVLLKEYKCPIGFKAK